MSAGDLQQLCAGADHVSVNVCRVYILGVAQGVALGLNIADGKTKVTRACLPDAVAAEQLEETLKQRLDKTWRPLPLTLHRTRRSRAGIGPGEHLPCAKPAR